MKISTRGRYGVRLLVDIARNAPRPAPLSEISRRQNVSAPYLGQIAVILKNSGYIESVKGANGGFLLSKPASEIRISEVLRRLEGRISIIDPANAPETPYRKALRIGLYQKIDDAVEKVLDDFTLEALTIRTGGQGLLDTL